MAVLKRGGVRALAGIAALAVVALSAGCDWLKGSDLITRTSPFLSGLSISPATVSCEEEFTVGFTYDDPQGDVFAVHVTAVHEDERTTTEFPSALWNDDFDRGNGSATYPFSFTEGSATGTWTLSVTVEDDLGHTSNSVTGTIVLSGGC